MWKSVFTTAAVDNIDHNPSSTTAPDSLHGAGISLFQHPSFELEREERKFYKKDNTANNIKGLLSLTESYANAPPAILLRNDPHLPDIYKNIPSPLILEATEREKMYIQNHYIVLPVYETYWHLLEQRDFVLKLIL